MQTSPHTHTHTPTTILWTSWHTTHAVVKHPWRHCYPRRAAERRCGLTRQADPECKVDNVPDFQEEAEEPTASETSTLFAISKALEKVLKRCQMSDQLGEVLGNISRFASRTGVKEGKKEIIQISIEFVRALRKDLLTDLPVWYSALEGKISSLVNSQQQILDSPPNATRYTMMALFVIAPTYHSQLAFR